MGVFHYLMQAYMSDEVFAQLDEGTQEFILNRPAWVTAAFALAVFTGLLGCMGLILKKKWAGPLFLLSLISVILQDVYIFFLSDAAKLIEGGDTVMTVLVLVVCIFQIWLAKDATKKGWLK